MHEFIINPDISKLSVITQNKALEESLNHLLASIRTFLEMDVAFISEFSSTHRIFRYVDSKAINPTIKVGGFDPLEESCCKKIVDRKLPQIIHDITEHPIACNMDVVKNYHIRAMISVPIILSNEDVFGTLCCFSQNPNWALNERDLNMMEVFGEIIAKQINLRLVKYSQKEEIYKNIKAFLDDGALSIVYQPIYDIYEERVVGFESLSRFNTFPQRNPDVWFAEAEQVGLGIALELKAAKKALEALTIFPNDVYVSINLSPETILRGNIEDFLKNIPLDRVVLEITEHSLISHYSELTEAVNHLRSKNLWFAVDDAGAGYASFKHILKLAPEIIKLDMSLIQEIHNDNARKALAAAFVGFSKETHCQIIAEGVNTADELKALKGLGIKFAQGFFLGKPMLIDNAMQLFETH